MKQIGGRSSRRLRGDRFHKTGAQVAATNAGVTLGDTVFDRVVYDREADVLYLHAGDPREAVDFDESAEGHALRYDAAGRLVGVTIVNARKLMEQDGSISITRPQPTWRLDASEVGAALGLAGSAS